jgi:hypothetical protein
VSRPNWSSNLDLLRTVEAIVVILERGYSDELVADQIGRDSECWGPRFERWRSSDADFGIVIAIRPGDNGIARFRSALIEHREQLPAAVSQAAEYLAEAFGGGKRIAWLQGGSLAPQTQEILQDALGVLPSPWEIN